MPWYSQGEAGSAPFEAVCAPKLVNLDPTDVDPPTPEESPVVQTLLKSLQEPLLLDGALEWVAGVDDAGAGEADDACAGTTTFSLASTLLPPVEGAVEGAVEGEGAGVLAAGPPKTDDQSTSLYSDGSPKSTRFSTTSAESRLC